MGEAAEVGSTANNYQILARLATGGMAEIFLARGVAAAGVERHCVLKRILRSRASDVSFVRMFLDEARLAAQLQHPNVAQVYDIGKLGDSYFFTMEYVHGETVRAIMQRARSLRREVPLAAILTIIAGAAAGLHHAHERIGMDGRPLHIVHRDVSPSNLMVSYEGSVKVVDFGVAKAADRATETRSGTVKGKISYLSPEQARGSSNIDRRSDLFSLGIVLWEMLTGERLYKRSSDFENMTAIVTEAPPPPSSRGRWIAPELDAISLKLLAKDPNERFQTADELIEELERFAGRSGTIISSSALSRFLRDMFGQRPEPWVELDTADAPEGITVTSEPIPSELAIPVEQDMDLELQHVPRLAPRSSERLTHQERPVPQVQEDFHVIAPGIVPPLTDRRTAPRAASLPPDVDYLPTTPHPKIDAPTTPHPKVDPMTRTLSDASPPPPRPSAPPSVPPPLPPSRPSPVNSTLAGVGGGNGPHAKIPSGPQSPHVTPSQGSRSYETPTSLPHPAAPAAPAVETPRPRIGWQLAVVIAIAAIVGSGTMWFVMRSGSSDKVATKTELDAAVVEEPSEVDATPMVVEPPPPVDAAEEPQVAVDAAVEELDVEPDWNPESLVPEPKPEAKPKPPKKTEAEINFENLVTACKARNDDRARSLYNKLPRARKKAAVAACAKDKIDLDPKPDKKPEKPKPEKKTDPCEDDPMSCQH